VARGFADASEFDRIIGWKLCEVVINKHHAMFRFDHNRGLLNVAISFSYCSADKAIEYSYEIYGPAKFLNADRILYIPITGIDVPGHDQLDIIFANGDVLTVHDVPIYRSWWFIRYGPDRELEWIIEDDGYP
jgi:hypothetical protein